METSRVYYRCLAVIFAFSVVMVATYVTCRGAQAQALLTADKNDEPMLLDLLGYNYTDRYIDDYSVNGQGGGNVFVSTPTSGGSGVTCCVRLSRNNGLPIIVRVRWQYGGCTYLQTSKISGISAEYTYSFYKEADVKVENIEGKKPAHFETHFYPDGSVHARITEHDSAPQFLLKEGRSRKGKFPRCKNDEKPE